MSDANLIAITNRITRLISDTVVSGTFDSNELEYYAQDALPYIETDYPDFTSYTVVVGSGIAPAPTRRDASLISLKAAYLALQAVLQESLADAILVRAGIISLDTSKSLKDRTESVKMLNKQYQDLVDKLAIDYGNTSGSAGARIDVSIEVDSDTGNEDSDSLN